MVSSINPKRIFFFFLVGTLQTTQDAVFGCIFWFLLDIWRLKIYPAACFFKLALAKESRRKIYSHLLGNEIRDAVKKGRKRYHEIGISSLEVDLQTNELIKKHYHSQFNLEEWCTCKSISLYGIKSDRLSTSTLHGFQVFNTSRLLFNLLKRKKWKKYLEL